MARSAGGAPRSVRARALVNAAGPWVGRVLDDVVARGGRGEGRPLADSKRVRQVKGSHIVIPRLHEGDHAYILQHTDGRVVFIIPYEGSYALIGTTDVAYVGNPADARVTEGEIAYLCAAVNRYLIEPVTPERIVWSYAGVRPLYDDARRDISAITRDYVFDIDAPEGRAPFLSIFGGKITTYRRLAGHALRRVARGGGRLAAARGVGDDR